MHLLSPQSRRGFALVSILMMVVLMAIVLAALFSALRLATSAGGNQMLRMQARDQAMLGLKLALNELQRESGPDQRITATSSLLDNNPATTDIDGVSQANWTGVWDTYQFDGVNPPPSVSGDKTGTLRRWLVSSPEGQATNPALPLTVPGMSEQNSVVLVGSGSLGETAEETQFVRAWLQDGDDLPGNRQGSYAWWVGDEGVKARVNLAREDVEATDVAAQQEQLAAAPRTALEVNDAFEDLETGAPAVGRVLTRDQLPLGLVRTDGSAYELAPYFHDVTPYSKGVLANVKDGGLRKDLNLLFELDELPTAYSEQPMYAATGAPSGPAWDIAHRYYRTYKDFTLDANNRPSLDLNAINLARFAEGNRELILPLGYRVQYLFGFFKADENYWYSGQPPETKDEVVYMVCYPVLHIWNPYNFPVNVELKRDQTALFWTFGVPPLEVSFDGGTSYKRMDRIFWEYAACLYTAAITDDTVLDLKPGEVRIFGPREINASEARTRFLPGEYGFGGTTEDGADAETLKASSNPIRHTDMEAGWDPNVGFHSYSLRTGGFSTIKTAEVGSLSIKLRYTDQPKFSQHANYGYEWRNIGVWQFDGSSNEPDEDIYDLSELEFPTVSVGSLGDINNPFLVFSFTVEQKIYPEDDMALPNKIGLFHDPTDRVALLDKPDSAGALLSGFEMRVTPLTGDETTVDGKPAVAYDPSQNDRGYFGDLSQGIFYNVHKNLPTMPLMSLPQLSGAPLGRDYSHPAYLADNWIGSYNYTATDPGSVVQSVVGNSQAHPEIPAESLRAGRKMDHSYFANEALWDGWFFSSLTPQEAALYPEKRTASEVWESFSGGTQPLPNRLFAPHLPTGQSADDIPGLLFDSGDVTPEAHALVSQYLLLKGAFNVNSTSVEAWTSLLGAAQSAQVPYFDPAEDADIQVVADDRIALPRYTMSGNAPADGMATPEEKMRQLWSGFRSLDEEEVRELAEAMVAQVKQRGPFRSLAEFVNRQASTDAGTNQQGAVAAALATMDVNDDLATPIVPADAITAANLANPQALQGAAAAGTVGYLSQADVLTPIAPMLAARSDTFLIRSYGEVKRDDVVLSRASCEAVVQRLPDYMDPADPPESTPEALTSAINQQLGRRYQIVQFRWLNIDEL